MNPVISALSSRWGFPVPKQVYPAFKKSRYDSPKACFYNAHQYVSHNHEAKYVLGYIDYKGVPIEHAFIKIGNEYYDITCEDVSDQTYYSCVELSYDQVKQLNIPKGEIDFYRYNKNKSKLS